MSEAKVEKTMNVVCMMRAKRKKQAKEGMLKSHNEIRDEIEQLTFKITGGDYLFERDLTNLIKLLKLRKNSKAHRHFMSNMSMYDTSLIKLAISRFALLRASVMDEKKGKPSNYFLGMLNKMSDDKGEPRKVYLTSKDEFMSSYNQEK